jgi:hypothetical protein
MNPAATPILRDDELVEMLIDEPQLLALADGLVATKRRALEVVTVTRPVRRAAAAVATVSALGALLLASPWQGSSSIVEKALAAVGSGPVLHVVVSQPAEFSDPVLDLKTGKTIPRTLRTELWFDSTRNLKKTIFRLDDAVLDEQLETRHGGWTREGPIYTCAWIAAHPAEATRAGVSCNASGENGTTPRVVPEDPPTLEPALAGFVDNYRTALASGDARETGREVVEGHDVVWLQFRASRGVQRVAVDAQTYAPLLIEQEGTPAYHVLTAEALPYDPSYFPKPKRVTTQSGGSVASTRDLTTTEAASILGSRAQWLGETWKGLRLTEVTLEERAVGYGRDHGPGRVEVLRLRYAPVESGSSSPIDIYEALTCVVSVGWTCTPRDPTTTRTMGLFGFISLVRSGELYISIWNPGRAHEPLEIARALVPIEGAAR